MIHYLPVGHTIKNPNSSTEYTIERVLGRGSSSIAYLSSCSDGSERILKEYYPIGLEISRSEDGTIQYSTCDSEKFKEGLIRFTESGDRQNALRKRTYLKNGIPPLCQKFSANATCYLDVIPFEGQTFNSIEKLSLIDRLQVCLTTAKMIKRLHEDGKLFLDIKPENIFVLSDFEGSIVRDLVVLIDFDSVVEIDKISFGESLSFTEAWAAPEQINPHGFYKISEATDVYALGELVFWSVFGRHSTSEEHRGFSQYTYEEISATQPDYLLPQSAEDLFTKLFHHTLRSSIRNRFSSVEPVIHLLDEIIQELSKKEFVVASEIRPNKVFLGRSQEMSELEIALQSNRIVFVSGIAGIGKSELVKQYVTKQKKRYDHILFWTYDGSLAKMIADDSSVSISSCIRLEDETDKQYATRKLQKLSELLSGKENLIVLDNMNCLFEELEEQDTLTRIKNLQAQIIVSTRANELLFKSISIEPISNSDDLVQVFDAYSKVSDDQIPYVKEIISSVGNHTLLVELLAHYTRATHGTPEETLCRLTAAGIGGISNENVRLSKDGITTSDSVFAHVERIFAMGSISQDQSFSLAKLSLMPVDGVESNEFSAFFSLSSFCDINELINHGWVRCSGINDHYISVHPTIAAVVIERFKRDPDALDELLKSCVKAIKVWKSNSMVEARHVALVNSLADAVSDRFAIKGRSAAIFLERYVGMYSKHGDREKKLTQIEIAINELKQSIPNDKYSAVRAQCYCQKAKLLVSLSRFDEAVAISEKSLREAKAVKDYYFAAKWCIILSNIFNVYQVPKAWRMQYKYYFTGIYYTLLTDTQGNRKARSFLNDENLLERLDYDYLANSKGSFSENLLLDFANIMENQNASILFCSKRSSGELSNLQHALNLRERSAKDRTLNYRPNSSDIVITKARIEFINGRYIKAEELLQSIVDFYDVKKMSDTPTTYVVHQFLAQIALRKVPTDTGKAISEFERCLEIAEQLSLRNTYLVRLELGYLYVKCGQMEKADQLNYDLWQETRCLDAEIRKTFYADALRNVGYQYYLQGKHFVARNLLRRALKEYGDAKAPLEMIDFGRARTYWHLGELYYSYNGEDSEPNPETAIERLTTAISHYKDCVGLDHPEAKTCADRLDAMKNQ